jgi:hypothetical protein
MFSFSFSFDVFYVGGCRNSRSSSTRPWPCQATAQPAQVRQHGIKAWGGAAEVEAQAKKQKHSNEERGTNK